jgi:hypothetical protein
LAKVKRDLDTASATKLSLPVCGGLGVNGILEEDINGGFENDVIGVGAEAVVNINSVRVVSVCRWLAWKGWWGGMEG